MSQNPSGMGVSGGSWVALGTVWQALALSGATLGTLWDAWGPTLGAEWVQLEPKRPPRGPQEEP